MTDLPVPRPSSLPRLIARVVPGLFLLLTGISHLTFGRAEFSAQVPDWMPLSDDIVIVASGVAEVALGAALIALPRYRVSVGWMTAAFFVLIFYGNIQLTSRYQSRTLRCCRRFESLRGRHLTATREAIRPDGGFGVGSAMLDRP